MNPGRHRPTRTPQNPHLRHLLLLLSRTPQNPHLLLLLLLPNVLAATTATTTTTTTLLLLRPPPPPPLLPTTTTTLALIPPHRRPHRTATTTSSSFSWSFFLPPTCSGHVPFTVACERFPWTLARQVFAAAATAPMTAHVHSSISLSSFPHAATTSLSCDGIHWRDVRTAR